VSFGHTLALARRGRGLTQRELSVRLGVGVSTLAAWESEKDEREPSAGHLRELCRILHVSADVLLERVPFQLGPAPEVDTTLDERSPADQVDEALERAGDVVVKPPRR
jgi:transcriptional regulator with XRE-family HTH domain